MRSSKKSLFFYIILEPDLKKNCYINIEHCAGKCVFKLLSIY